MTSAAQKKSKARKNLKPKKLARKKATKKAVKHQRFDWRGLAPTPIIGVDEVGRGCLAGRVWAAAVVLPPGFKIRGITDSKLLSEKRRDLLHAKIVASARVSLGFADVHEIDELNILWASMLAMKRAILGLGLSTGHVIVDGNTLIPDLEGYTQTTVVKGDLRAEPIGAASIVAKVTRDRELKQLSLEFPEYGFDKHKGYASDFHREAIKRVGPCIHHRKTFSGVREFLGSKVADGEGVVIS